MTDIPEDNMGDIPEEDKIFFAVWGLGYMDDDEAKFDGHWLMSDMTVENGYFEEYIEHIKEMEIGESYNLPDVISNHSVVRLK